MPVQKLESFRVDTKKIIFSKGPIHLVDVNVRMRDGKVLSRQIIEHPGAAVIIPRRQKDSFILRSRLLFIAAT